MPSFVKLTDADIEALKIRRGQGPSDRYKQSLAAYKEFLATVEVGSMARVSPDENDGSRTLKRRLNLAAKALGYTLKYRRTIDDSLLFERIEKPVGEAAANGHKRGRKQAAAQS